MIPSIVLTGGGTAGHVTPNIALIEQLKNEGWKIYYIGSAQGIEGTLIQSQAIPFYAVSSGKLRRYFSIKNLFAPFKIFVGILHSFWLLRKLKPTVVFSKGGFVAFPVVIGAWLNRIAVVAHESDLSPGLANRLSYPFVDKICLTFEGSKCQFKSLKKIVVTGTPIRKQLFSGSIDKGLELCKFNTDKPCLLVLGGSLGANSINQLIRAALNPLLQQFQIIHICGKGKLDPALTHHPGYCQFEYVNEQLAHLMAAASVVVSRSGANSLYELLALHKAHILIPLSSEISRGDQIQNARYFQKLGVSRVIEDPVLDINILLNELKDIMENKKSIEAKIKTLDIKSATNKIIVLLNSYSRV